MASVSAVILTRDSERTIGHCVKALKPAVDNVIVVDTGSSDDTVQIAKDNGSRVYHFEWRDDFSAARNFGDSLATSEWVLHVDSDEILRPDDVNKIRQTCTRYRKTDNPPGVSIRVINIIGDDSNFSEPVRMYKRGVLTWRGIIHEQLYVRRGGLWQQMSSDIGVIHDGYNPDVVNTRDKYLRNIQLLRRAIEQEPDNYIYHFFLGRDLGVINEYKSALPHLQTAVKLMEQQNITGKLNYARGVLADCIVLAKN